MEMKVLLWSGSFSMEQAVVDQLAVMAEDASETRNEVRLALDRAAISWRELSDQRRQTFIPWKMRRCATTNRLTNLMAVQVIDKYRIDG
jgi:hypothetical protein